jgi:hypothetical protein
MNHLIVPKWENELPHWGITDNSVLFVVWSENDPVRVLTLQDLTLKQYPNPTACLVVFNMAEWRQGGGGTLCIDLLRKLLGKGMWTVWFHQDQGQPVTPKKRADILKSNEWIDAKLVESGVIALEQYSRGAEESSEANRRIGCVGDKVRDVITQYARISFCDVYELLNGAVSDKQREKRLAGEMCLLEDLFPSFLEDPSGSTVDDTANRALAAFLVEALGMVDVPMTFRDKFTLLSRHVANLLRGLGRLPEAKPAP